MKTLEELREDVYNFYGSSIETKKTIEELDELKEAIENNHATSHIAEEIADVHLELRRGKNPWSEQIE